MCVLGGLVSTPGRGSRVHAISRVWPMPRMDASTACGRWVRRSWPTRCRPLAERSTTTPKHSMQTGPTPSRGGGDRGSGPYRAEVVQFDSEFTVRFEFSGGYEVQIE